MKVFQDAAAARDARYAAWGLKGRKAPRVRASMRIYEAPGRRTEKPFTRPARQWPRQGGLELHVDYEGGKVKARSVNARRGVLIRPLAPIDRARRQCERPLTKHEWLHERECGSLGLGQFARRHSRLRRRRLSQRPGNA